MCAARGQSAHVYTRVPGKAHSAANLRDALARLHLYRLHPEFLCVVRLGELVAWIAAARSTDAILKSSRDGRTKVPSFGSITLRYVDLQYSSSGLWGATMCNG